MNAEQFSSWLKKYSACSDSYAETTGKSLSEWWEITVRPDWMIWVLRRLPAHKEDKALFVRIAIASARHVLHLVPAGEERPRLAIDAAEAWLLDPSEANMDAAMDAAKAAAGAARAAAWAAGDAAGAALCAKIREIVQPVSGVE